MSHLTDPQRLARTRTGARAILALGIGASLGANVLAADPSIAGRVIAAWSPIALLLTVELLSRVPVAAGRLSKLRVAAAATIAAIAAWVSYWHMVEVATTFGEATVAAHLLPLSVDGLVVVASVCLVEITNRLGESESAEPAVAPSATEPDMPPAETPALPSTTTPATKGQTRPADEAKSPVAETVRRLAAEQPEWTRAEIAEAAGCSVRTVRRHLAAPAKTSEPEPHHESQKAAA